MKLTISTLLLCLFFAFSTSAQTRYSIKGTVGDSSSNAHLTNTAIMLLNAKDSTLREFTRASATGAFSLTKLTKGKFIILMTYPGYADYVEHFTVDSLKPVKDMGKVYLTLKSRILKEVMIKGTVAAIKIKGDTTVFDPRAYTIQANSKVEDLLKQLPGIQVDKDGKITAQGQAVPKVLVDGEEFFGDDPTLVTKNIRGDMVKEVQLFDKKSDQATLTGIDDGVKTKTINIVLKDDKKNGYFGKLDGGIGTDGYYSEQALYNRFQGKKKFSIYGIAANTGKTGLGWEDANRLGASGDDGVIFFSGDGGGSDLDSYDGRYNGQGIPKAYSGGVHYDNKFDKDNKTINTNYKLGSLEVDGIKNTLTQKNQLGSILNTNADQNFHNSVFRQKADISYTNKVDTTANMRFNADATIKNSKNTSDNIATSTNGAGVLLNRNNRNLTNNVDGRIFNGSFYYNRKLKKTGRTIFLNAYGNYTESDAKGYLNSGVNFYNKTTGALDSIQRTDQYKTTFTKSLAFTSNFNYTEPLTKKISLSVGYSVDINNSTADRKSFNKSATGAYNLFDTKFSSDYTVNQLSNQVNAGLNYRGAKANINVGGRVSAVNFNQIDQLTSIAYKRNFINWNPNANYQYRFSQQKSLRINYYGSTSQPSIDQVQPIRNNNDNLNIVLGNPNLKPSFNNSFGLNFNSYKVLSNQSIYVGGNFSFRNNAIINNSAYDSTGKSVTQAINLVGHTPINYNVYSEFSRKILGKAAINLGFEFNVSGSKSYSYSSSVINTATTGNIFANNVLNTSTSNNFSILVGLSKSVSKKFEVNINGGPGYTLGKSSLQPALNNNGYTFSTNGSFVVYLPGKFEIRSDGNYDYRGKTQSFNETFSRFILNSGISKKFLKQENLKFSVSGNDILNQNTGFSRSSFSGNITQNTNTTIRRYFMFSIVWDFTKMGGAPEAKK